MSSNPALLTITVARKPVASGSIAENVLKYGTGALNIEATRIPSRSSDTSPNQVLDRWPANFVLQHAPSCQGSRCGAGCAIADVDAQDANNSSGSLFFLNLPADAAPLPPLLMDYLQLLTTVAGGHCLVLGSLDGVVLDGGASGHYHSAIVKGEPTLDQTKELLRVLRPGGHLFILAPDHRPSGHVGACRAEDAGFEIRDCILWAREAGHVHYVPKPSTAEREAGLGHLPERSFAPSGGAQDALAAAEESGEGDTAEYGGAGDIGYNRITRRRNSHPTIKPKTLMARLLRTVPSDQGPVLDPFMGSGTTMLACLETGHDGIGIEREAEYIEIADARVRHWNAAQAAWDAALIESDHQPSESADTQGTLEDLLGL